MPETALSLIWALRLCSGHPERGRAMRADPCGPGLGRIIAGRSGMTRAIPVVLICAAVAGGVHLVAQQPTFRTETELVSFGVTVVDRRGNFIRDLQPEDFEIIEEGKRQTIRVFARGDATEAAPKMHVGLLFDTSGSMGEDIKLSRSAA